MNLTAIYESMVNTLSDSMIQFPWADAKAYGSFLAQTYYYTRHSTKLLTLSASRFGFNDYDLHRRFIQHSQEERGHEFMCLKDMQRLGLDIAQFPEQTSTAAFYQRQYYLIEHVDPICFLGYVLCLEGLSAKAAGQVSEKVKTAHRDKASLFVRAHSDEDPDHIEKAFNALEGLTPERMNLVVENLQMSCTLYAEMMREAKAFAAHVKLGQAA